MKREFLIMDFRDISDGIRGGKYFHYKIFARCAPARDFHSLTAMLLNDNKIILTDMFTHSFIHSQLLAASECIEG